MGKENLTPSFLSKEIKFFQENLKQIGIIFALVILISLLFPGGEALKYSYKINDITREPIIAPYTFPILKTEKNYADWQNGDLINQNNYIMSVNTILPQKKQKMNFLRIALA